jgi:uncharacterized repeat protein (TIGR03803 family)
MSSRCCFPSAEPIAKLASPRGLLTQAAGTEWTGPEGGTREVGRSGCGAWTRLAWSVSLGTVLLAGALSARAAERQVVDALLPADALSAEPIGQFPRWSRLSLTIALPLRNQDELAQFLQDVYDPASPSFRQYLTPDQFAVRFGPAEQDYQAVIQFAQQNGLTVTTRHPNRLLVDVNGGVAQVERAFHITMRKYQHPTENRTFYAPDRAPSVDLAVRILGVSGLSDYSLPQPRLRSLREIPSDTAQPNDFNAGSGPGGTYMGNDFRAAYAPGTTLTGAGQVVGLLQWDGYYANDIVYYEQKAGLPNVPLQNVLLGGASGNPTGGGDVEVCLDIESAISIAPGLAKVILYIGGSSASWHDILNRMATDNLAQQLSCSWYIPGGGADPVADQIWQQMAAQGQSFFNASGDSDAYTGPISWPGETPYIMQVGGTTLTTSIAGGPWTSETVWNWGSGTGSSGGVSTRYTIPYWQTNAITPASQGSLTMRNTPDVALTADNVYVRCGGRDYNVGGTSAAAPLWAGYNALINQLARANGEPLDGFINPAVYALGQTARYPSAFHDIVTGNNQRPGSGTKFPAVVKYDLCTGWGTPAGDNLITELGLPEPLRISPQGGAVISGPVGGPFNPNPQTFVLSNNAAGSLPWMLVNSSPWLDVSPTSGLVASAGPPGVVNVSASSAATNLAPGAYASTLWFTNLNNGFGQSRLVTLAVVTPPVITSQPGDQPVLQGATATFTVGTGDNALLYYRWLRNGSLLSDGGQISGSTGATLAISNATTANVGAYSVIVSNAAGTALSSNAVLSIVPSAPVITMQPINQTVLPGAPATFRVAVVGNTPYAYQWQLNGTNLVNGANVSGALTSRLTINSVFQPNAGTYSVVVTNSLGSIASTGAVLAIIPVTAPGVALTTLSSMGSGTDGQNPYSPLVQARDGNFYGTTLQGGANGFGTVFRMTAAGVRTTLVTFTYNNGGAIYAGLDLGRDGFLYGAALEGDGTYGDGTVFRVTTGGGFGTLGRFNGNNGMFPVSGLVQGTDGNFYGTTLQGGVYGLGVAYRATVGGLITPLVAFNGNDGAYPSSVLVQGPDGSFYGTTESGGPNGGAGTIFKVTSTGNFTLLHTFSGNDGSVPVPGLALGADDYFYGTTYQGGTNGGGGTVFRITASGAFTSLYSFTGSNDGANPWGGLVQASDGNLYGTTQSGGTYAAGTIFRFAPNGPLSKIADFDNYNGGAPSAALIQGTNGSLYGTTQLGGTNGAGAVFQLTIGGPLQISGQPANQLVFLGDTAIFDVATVGAGPVWYQWRKGGIALTNGSNVLGATNRTLVITNVAMNNVGTYSVVVSNASGLVTSAGAALEVIFAPPYIVSQPANQTVVAGATAVFAVQALGDEPLFYQWLMDGTNLADTATIVGSATPTLTITGVSAGNAGAYSVVVANLFDVAQSSDADLQVVPATAGGVAAATYHSFSDSTDGALSYAGLVQARDNNLYGTASGGGSKYLGTVFRQALNGGFSTMYAFSDGTTGAYPYGRLVQGTDNNLYGTTFSGGTNGYGTIFRMTTGGFMTFLYSFVGSDDGQYPYAGLALGPDGNFYGTAYQGGTGGYGTVFRVKSNGVVTPVYAFTSANDGAYPYAGLTFGTDGKLYGTTLTSGTNGYGTVFQLTTNGVFRTVFSFGYTNGALPQAGVVQGADGKLYGTTYEGGDSGFGTVFQLTTDGNLKTLVSFDSAHGANPLATLTFGTDGNLYGTTFTGGAGGQGTVFRVTPDGNFMTLYWFDGFNGAGPQAQLVQANDGYFYGTTSYGGIGYNRTWGGGYGLVYRLTVPIFMANPFSASSAIAALPYTNNISSQARSGPGDVLTFGKVGGPAWLTVATDGTVSGTPGNADRGTNVFVVSLSDTNGFFATTTMQLVVNTNQPPSFVGAPLVKPWANVDQPYGGTVATNATDPELNRGDQLSFAKVSGPAWLTVGPDGTLTGTPQGLDGGTNSFVVSVTDLAGNLTTATMSIYVNRTPYFTSSHFVKPAATVGLPYAGTIATDAVDPDLGAGDYLTFYKVNGPAWLSVADDGSLSGTPAPADVGPGIALVLAVDSGGLAGIGYLGVTVNTDSPPVFAANPFTAPAASAGVAYSASIAGAATDPDFGDVVRFGKSSGPAWLSVTANGALVGTPGSSDAGLNTFQISATDFDGLSTQATMNLTVAGALTVTITREGDQVRLSWTGGNPPYQVQAADGVLPTPEWYNIGEPVSTGSLLLTPSNSAACYRVVGQ